MIPSTVASRALHAARWHRSKGVLARVDLCTQRSSLSTYSNNSGYSYFASNTATTRHDNSNSIGLHQSNRMASSIVSSSFGSPAEKNTSPTSSSSPRSDNNYTDKQDQMDYSTGNNSTRTLRQYHDMPPRKSHPRNNENGRGPVHDFRQRRQAVASQQQDGGAPRHRNDTNNNYANRHRKNQVHNMNRERPRWRSKNTTSDNRPKNNNADSKPELALATSEWIKVSNIPPMSKLSDVFPSLNRIIDYEMEKGIIDLDALDNMGVLDNVTSHALDAVGALNSMYSTQQIISDGNHRHIPLWTPPSSDSDDKEDEEVFPMILEARVHLSYRARPMGWFLRLPNRSVVHAILNHVHRADNEVKGKWQLSNEAKNVKQQRKQWRDGLWKGVFDEYESAANEEGNRMALEDESYEKELMWGDGLGEEEEDDKSSEKRLSEEGVETVEVLHAEEQQSDVDSEEQQKDADAKKKLDSVEDYLEEYTQSHPFPTQSPKLSAAPTPSVYQQVKSGSTALHIREFLPFHSDSLPNDEHPPWEQHSFHLSPLLNLSDSVVRVETENLRSTEEDIQYCFRGYDLEAIVLKPEGSSLFPSNYLDIPKAIGWNVNMKGNIDFLVKGTHHPERQNTKFPRADRKERVPIGARRHTFLVRFASSADARMAVRDKKGTPRDGQHLDVTQYPQQW